VTFKAITSSFLFTAILLHPLSSTAGQKTSPETEKAISVIEKLNSGLKRFVMDNGMVALVKEDHSAPVTSIRIWIGTGSIHENEYLGSGLSHAIEHMIFKGTAKRSPVDITREINDAGGDINAYTSLDRTVFLADLPARNWKVGLNVLSDALMHASLPEDEWKKEKEVILREFAMGNDSPEQVLDKLLWTTAFNVHPYRMPVIGHEQVFRKITRKDIAAFFNRNYVPDNMIVSVVGDINAKEVEDGIRSTFAAFERKSRAPVCLPGEPAQLAPRFARETGAYNVSRMEWVYHTVPISHEDVPALDLLAVMAGGGRSSRLVSNIQEKQKLVHSISCSSYTLKENGLFEISTVFDPAKEKEAIAAIDKEISSWQASRFPAAELDKARRILLNNELSNLQTTAGQAENYASGEFYTGDARYSETYLRIINTITPETLRSVTGKYLRPANRSIVILSPAAAKDASQEKTPDVPGGKPEKIVLNSGIPLVVLEDRKLPFVYFCMAARGGLLSETVTNNGITCLMSELLTRGTAGRSASEIAEDIESMGAALFSFSGQDDFGIQGRCLSGNAGTMMKIMCDCMLNPSFPDNEVSKQKTIQLSEIDQQLEDPLFLAQKEIRKLLFPDHPYRWTSTGSRESVSKIGRSDILSHFRRLVVSGNLAISIIGDISPAAARTLAEKYLSGIPKAPAPAMARARAKPVLPARSSRVEPREQAVFMAGFPGVDIRDPRADAMTLLSTATSGLSSSLGVTVREERGLAYYVGSYHITETDPGAFIFYAGIRKDALAEVETLINQEIRRLTVDGFGDDEMERARNQVIAEYKMGLQDKMEIGKTCALNELNGLGYSHLFNARKRFESLTKEKVREAAASILSTNMAAVSIILPGAGNPR